MQVQMRSNVTSGHVLRYATFGCVPISDDERMRSRLDDFCAALGDALGISVRAHRAHSPRALATAYQSGRLQLVWSSPTLFLTDPALHEAVPLVQCVRAGASSYVGCLYVRRDSPIRSMNQLLGARVAWVAETSAGGYLFPKIALAECGKSVDVLFTDQTFHGSYGAVLDAVESGSADVGATFAVFVDGKLRQAAWAAHDASAHPYRVVLTSPSIPSDLIVATETLLERISVDPVRAFVELGQRPEIGEIIKDVVGADGFEPADREALELARGHVARHFGAVKAG